MAKSTALAPLPKLSDIGSVSLPAAILGELTKAGDYLERLQLYQGTSSLAKQGLIGPGHYGIPKNDNVDDLGDTIDVVVFAVRPKALDTSADPIVANYDPASADFKRIQETAETVKESGCMFGLEFLVFERTTGKFLTYFANSASAKVEAGKMLPDQEARPLTLKSQFVEKKRYSWHVPVVQPCSVPFSNLPAVEKIIAVIEKFNNPSSEGGEAASAAETKAVSGRRR